MKEKTPWFEVIHCFNHRLEIALKDAFQQSPAFEWTKSLITNLHNLYQTSPKQLCCLTGLTEAHKKSDQKPTKVVEIDGWISNTLQ